MVLYERAYSTILSTDKVNLYGSEESEGHCTENPPILLIDYNTVTINDIVKTLQLCFLAYCSKIQKTSSSILVR